MQPTFITNAEVMKTVNNSDSEAYEIEVPNECEERDQDIVPPEETDYTSVEQEIALESQLQRNQKV
jgi:hypothetical protein